MRTKEQIKDQRLFMKKVSTRIDELGFLYSFVAKKIGISSARLSQFLGGDRQLPLRYRVKLTEFLKIS